MIRDTFKNSSLFVKISIVLFLLLVGLSIFITLGILLSALIFQMNISDVVASSGALKSENIALLKFLQSMYSIGLFVFPAVVAAWLFGNGIDSYLQLNKKPNFSIFVAIILVLVIAPIVNVVVQWNESITFPASLRSLETVMRQMEDNAKKMTNLFLNADSFSVYLTNIVVLALVPAVGEELLFRGVLQKLLYDYSKKIHLAIWLSAFLFSALHFQFYGFFPRMLLGALFGYLLFWSKNLWIPIISHFINNLLAVSVYYFNDNVGKNIDNIGTGKNAYIYIIASIFLFLSLLFYFYKINRAKQSDYATLYKSKD